MSTHVERQTVDLSGCPDLVVIYLGMRVRRIAGIKTLLGFGPKISASAAAGPMDSVVTRRSFILCSRCTSVCDSTGVMWILC